MSSFLVRPTSGVGRGLVLQTGVSPRLVHGLEVRSLLVGNMHNAFRQCHIAAISKTHLPLSSIHYLPRPEVKRLNLQISTAPAVAPAITLRSALGFSLRLASAFCSNAGADILAFYVIPVLPLLHSLDKSCLSSRNTAIDSYCATLVDDSLLGSGYPLSTLNGISV